MANFIMKWLILIQKMQIEIKTNIRQILKALKNWTDL